MLFTLYRYEKQIPSLALIYPNQYIYGLVQNRGNSSVSIGVTSILCRAIDIL